MISVRLKTVHTISSGPEDGPGERVPHRWSCDAERTGSIGGQVVFWNIQLFSVRRPKVTPIGISNYRYTQLGKITRRYIV